MTMRILRQSVGTELDVVAARQRAREIAVLCGFGMQDQVRIATTVSELARNVYNYAQGGKIEFSIVDVGAAQALQIVISDQGPGIGNLDLILSGNYQSQTGMGMGIIGARRLMDRCDIDTGVGRGTEFILHKLIPGEAPRLTLASIGALCAKLAARAPDSMLGEVQQQNQDLLRTLAELKERQEQLLQLTRQLEETNRGVTALYAELDEKNGHLRHADQMKSRFLSNMSHEFRTPLSSIRALSRILLARTDGELSVEQEKQVGFILQGTTALNEMVDDLLDLAKIESGKVDVRAATFMVADLFSTLRGMLHPLLVGRSLKLVFHEPAAGASLHTDQGKLSQILRNFVSNAIKYTEQGEVAVSAEMLPGGAAMRFGVSDTGIGIEARYLETIFEEFSQIESHLQTKVKGTGLGLPLCRKLGELLGGTVGVSSTAGAGSVFTVVIPAHFVEPEDAQSPSTFHPPT